MKHLILICAVLLAGCNATVPVKQYFPEVPAPLLKKCPQLKTIKDENIPLSELLKIVTENYTEYHACASLVENWQLWYKMQKDIFDDLND